MAPPVRLRTCPRRQHLVPLKHEKGNQVPSRSPLVRSAAPTQSLASNGAYGIGEHHQSSQSDLLAGDGTAGGLLVDGSLPLRHGEQHCIGVCSLVTFTVVEADVQPADTP